MVVRMIGLATHLRTMCSMQMCHVGSEISEWKGQICQAGIVAWWTLECRQAVAIPILHTPDKLVHIRSAQLAIFWITGCFKGSWYSIFYWQWCIQNRRCYGVLSIEHLLVQGFSATSSGETIVAIRILSILLLPLPCTPFLSPRTFAIGFTSTTHRPSACQLNFVGCPLRCHQANPNRIACRQRPFLCSPMNTTLNAQPQIPDYVGWLKLQRIRHVTFLSWP